MNLKLSLLITGFGLGHVWGWGYIRNGMLLGIAMLFALDEIPTGC